MCLVYPAPSTDIQDRSHIIYMLHSVEEGRNIPLQLPTLIHKPVTFLAGFCWNWSTYQQSLKLMIGHQEITIAAAGFLSFKSRGASSAKSV